jgi:uracil-DNA glycosylase family 4
MTKSDCTLCPRRENCFQVLRGWGPLDAPVIIVGSVPDDESHAVGEAFHPSGQHGKRLDWLLSQLGLVQEQVRATYAVACWSPALSGRRPLPRAEDIQTCHRWLAQELYACLRAYKNRHGEEAIPLLVPVGSAACQSLLDLPAGTPAADVAGRAQMSATFPEFLDCIVPLMDWETLEAPIRTGVIESEWRRSLHVLSVALVEMSVLPEPDYCPPRPWPACTGPKPTTYWCRCRQHIIEELMPHYKPFDLTLAGAPETKAVRGGGWD